MMAELVAFVEQIAQAWAQGIISKNPLVLIATTLIPFALLFVGYGVGLASHLQISEHRGVFGRIVNIGWIALAIFLLLAMLVFSLVWIWIAVRMMVVFPNSASRFQKNYTMAGVEIFVTGIAAIVHVLWLKWRIASLIRGDDAP